MIQFDEILSWFEKIRDTSVGFNTMKSTATERERGGATIPYIILSTNGVVRQGGIPYIIPSLINEVRQMLTMKSRTTALVLTKQKNERSIG